MIDYSYMESFFAPGTVIDLLGTDGTLTVSGTEYEITDETVTITNAIIKSGSFELDSALCSQAQLRFGSCESSEVSVTVFDNIPSLKGKKLTWYIILNSDASTCMTLYTGTVVQDKLTADRTKRDVVMRDDINVINNADVAGWYNTTFPSSSSTSTIGAMRSSLLSDLDITEESYTGINDGETIGKTISPDTLSGADMIRWLQEANGVFGTITNEGKFRSVELSPNIDAGVFPSSTLYPSTSLYPSAPNPDITPVSKQYYTEVTMEDYMSEEITQLVIRGEDGDVGVTVGTAGNTYVISGNPLFYGMSSTQLTRIATNILSKIKNRYYKPCSVKCVGNPCHELGDPIRIQTTYRGLVTYILERRLKGLPRLVDEYEAQGEETYSENLNSIQSQFKQLEGKTLKIKTDVDGIETEVSDLASRTSSSISQLSSEISAKVDSSGGSPSSFGWTLTNSGFQLNSNNDTVFECTSQGTRFKNDGSSGMVDINDGSVDCYGSGGRFVALSGGQLECSNGSGVVTMVNSSGIEVVSGSHVSSLSATALEIDRHTLSFIPIDDGSGGTVYVLGYRI